MKIHTIGIDLGKTTFHLVALGERGKIIIRKKPHTYAKPIYRKLTKNSALATGRRTIPNTCLPALIKVEVDQIDNRKVIDRFGIRRSGP